MPETRAQVTESSSLTTRSKRSNAPLESLPNPPRTRKPKNLQVEEPQLDVRTTRSA